MESFRLLYISDMHIAVELKVIGFPDRRHLPQYPLGQVSLAPSSYDLDLAKAVAKHVSIRGSQLDAILITESKLQQELADAGEQAFLRRALVGVRLGPQVPS